MSHPIRSVQAQDFFPIPIVPKNPSIQAVQTQHLETFFIEGVGNLRALATLGKNIAWVGGTQGKIAKTEDEGKNWILSSIPNGEKLDVRALCLFDPKVACAMCAGSSNEGLSRVYRTVDGGITWSLVLCPESEGMFFNAMAFWDEKHGILLSDPVDDRFVLFTTEDGGETWKQLVPSVMPFSMPREQAFAASNSCLVVYGSENVWFATGGGPFARVFHSSDRGRHWSVATTPIEVNSASSGIFSLDFLDEKTGIAVGGDYQSTTSFSSPNIIMTTDGGKKWKVLDDRSFSGRYLSSVAWVSKEHVMVVDGSQGTFNSVAMTGNQGWAVGPSQRCAKF